MLRRASWQNRRAPSSGSTTVSGHLHQPVSQLRRENVTFFIRHTSSLCDHSGPQEQGDKKQHRHIFYLLFSAPSQSGLSALPTGGVSPTCHCEGEARGNPSPMCSCGGARSERNSTAHQLEKSPTACTPTAVKKPPPHREEKTLHQGSGHQNGMPLIKGSDGPEASL